MHRHVAWPTNIRHMNKHCMDIGISPLIDVVAYVVPIYLWYLVLRSIQSCEYSFSSDAHTRRSCQMKPLDWSTMFLMSLIVVLNHSSFARFLVGWGGGARASKTPRNNSAHFQAISPRCDRPFTLWLSFWFSAPAMGLLALSWSRSTPIAQPSALPFKALVFLLCAAVIGSTTLHLLWKYSFVGQN